MRNDRNLRHLGQRPASIPLLRIPSGWLRTTETLQTVRGGDEFVCALLALDLDSAAERFTLIRGTLAAEAHASISVGLAEYRTHDSLETLLARADGTLLAEWRVAVRFVV